MNYLLFQLYAPLVSWGVQAVGEVRRSAPYPGKSSIIGLLSAALGITRENEKDLLELSQKIRCGVKVLNQGEALRDYHTVQVPKASRKEKYYTRQEELAADKKKINTVLSRGGSIHEIA